jgi:phosphoribosyl-dephospho-CoA transferase
MATKTAPLAVHDLLRLRDRQGIVKCDQAPAWVRQSLSRAPWVVVRRAPFKGELIPVGVRGCDRSERFAGFADLRSIEESIHPEQLTLCQAWKRAGRFEQIPAMRMLPMIDKELRASGICWGPVGSIGFELASGLPAANRESDLDLIVRMDQIVIPRETIERLLAAAHGFRVDLIVETPFGGVSLLDYASGRQNLILRSINGPRLITHPVD